MDRHREVYSRLVRHRGANWIQDIKQRVVGNIMTRRRAHVDMLRQNNKSHELPAMEDVEEQRTFHEEQGYLRELLLQEAKAEHIEPDLLQELQKEILQEISSGLSVRPTAAATTTTTTTTAATGISLLSTPPPTESPFCPVCSQHRLQMAGTLVSCANCGLRLDVQSDGINLSHISSSLKEVFHMHSLFGCSRQIKLFVMHHSECGDESGTAYGNMTALVPSGIDLLWASCESCSFLEVVV